MPRPDALVARDTALLRLKDAHLAEFNRLYDEERVARGLPPLSSRRAERIADLRAQLARLEALEPDTPE
jgi:hypothetical protein